MERFPATPSDPEPSPPAAVEVQPAWAGPGARHLGRYLLGPALGRGGMGEVHEAWDSRLSRLVALKSLTVASAPATRRFLREARLQARVSHPNVCRIYDVDAGGAVPFIAMQRVRGPNLLEAAPGLTLAEGVEILHATVLGVNAAHRLGLIHRDLKPSNILLEPDGLGGWHAYVADFGLAKDLLAEDRTQTRELLGTPDFVPPEQLRGDPGALGPAADIYALGATLRALLERVQGQGPVPAQLRVIIARCLEERPRDRYPSAGELAEDLRRFLDGEPLLASRGSWRRELRRGVRRHPALAAGLGMFLLLGAGFGAWAVHLSGRGQRQAALAQRFALDARDLENRMRIERLVPVHDLRPATAQMLERLARIRADMARLGPEAQGPGNLALGRGYGALGELDLALAALDRAWAGGYATPEVAYALCKVHCDYGFLLAEREPAEDPDRSLAHLRAAHLEAARSFFNRANGAAWEPRELGEAGLLVQEGAFAAALAKARGVFKAAPWLYEAKVEEARALGGLGLQRLDRGERRAALSLFREASLAARAAQAIGHSDEACYLVDLEWRGRWLEQAGLPLAAALAAWDEAEHLADQLVALRADSPRAVLAKVRVILQRACALAAAGRDPEPELLRAERTLAAGAGLPGLEAPARLQRRWIGRIRAGFAGARRAQPLN